jgi:two-component system, NarL family, response regulator NreC
MLDSRKIRCALVLEHLLLRQGVRRLLEDEPEIEVIAEAGNAEDALREVIQHRPEIVIGDATVFGFAPERVELLLRRLSPATRVLFLSMEEEGGKAQNSPGDTGCVVKRTSAQELLDRVLQIHSAPGAVRELPRRKPADWPEVEATPQPRALTLREREVLKLLAEGRTVRSAASALGLSVKTVDAHKFNLMRKLGIHNKAELVMWAIRKRLVKVPSNF